MKIKHLLAMVFCWLSLSTFAQTKFIAHKSHSGSMKNFRLALKSKKFGLKFSNFGEAPIPKIKNAQLDSIIFLSKNTAVMVTSTYCKWQKEDKKSFLWKAGRDTVHNHFLFNKKNSVRYIKKVLTEKYHFRNPAEEVKFIDQPEKGSVVPLQPNQSKPFVLIGLIAGIALLAGAIAWKLRKAAMQPKP